ncbi:Hypothetical_protein [Hexamita inflata]|uniref:Hypothetical_protein n=1 Tax=Hexamita inflata TaxID=28002 RepID=A0AA86NDB5_9EUKA|nr:Hypothetical protein HINF_LOCUS3737 [Hexamita inflata]CAI9916949.1 Hypothetical protein HINF_LOCUS4594 [Hexamita inflata]
MNILDQKFQKILESLVREEPPQEVDLKSLPQSDLLFVSQLMKLLGKGDVSKMVQKDTKLSTHQEEELELIKLALQEADPKAAVYKQLVSKLNFYIILQQQQYYIILFRLLFSDQKDDKILLNVVIQLYFQSIESTTPNELIFTYYTY